jgi:hypothetical protein
MKVAALALCTLLTPAILLGQDGAGTAVLENPSGLRLLVDLENTQPVLRVVLPGRPLSDQTIEVIFPEHVTVRKTGNADSDHLYLWQPGKTGDQPAWRRDGQTFSYERSFAGGIRMVASATLESDGVLFRYELKNESHTAYDLVLAITDPRLTGIFHDQRLERTWVHHRDGWKLLGANTPARLSLPLDQWLPARYRDSYTWPVPTPLVKRDADGITIYDNPIPVDEPVVATVSQDGKWVVASFSRTAGSVWSNPELTCQHVDESGTLLPGGSGTLLVKMLVIQGSLDQVQEKVLAQRSQLK